MHPSDDGESDGLPPQGQDLRGPPNPLTRDPGHLGKSSPVCWCWALLKSHIPVCVVRRPVTGVARRGAGTERKGQPVVSHWDLLSPSRDPTG